MGMRVYQPAYKRSWGKAEGHLRHSPTWWIDFTDENARRWRMPISPDKELTESVLAHVQQLVNLKRVAMPMSSALIEWIARLPTALHRRLMDSGLIKHCGATDSLSLDAHINGTPDLPGYRQYLLQVTNERNAHAACYRVSRVLDAAGWTKWSDIRSKEVVPTLGRLLVRRGGREVVDTLLSPQTCVHYLTVLTRWAAWMVNDGRAMHNPLTQIRLSAPSSTPVVRLETVAKRYLTIHYGARLTGFGELLRRLSTRHDALKWKPRRVPDAWRVVNERRGQRILCLYEIEDCSLLSIQKIRDYIKLAQGLTTTGRWSLRVLLVDRYGQVDHSLDLLGLSDALAETDKGGDAG